MGKSIAIVLGGTIPHIELIKNLRNRGYYTILVDYLDRPPAKFFADEHIQESTMEVEGVHRIAKERIAKLVISTSIDQANLVACKVGEILGLPIPYSYVTALKVTNKTLMKEIMNKLDIPTSRFNVFRNFEDINEQTLKFPLVVKPSDATGSKGVRKCRDFTEFKKFFPGAFDISRNGEVIVEEYLNGTEVQLDFFVVNGNPKLLMTRKKVNINLDNKAVLQSFGSIVPAQLSSKALGKIQQVADKLAVDLSLQNTPLFIQAKIDQDNVNIIEFALRIGGGLSYSMIKIITGFDITNAAIDTFLNNKIDVVINETKDIFITYLIYVQPCIFGNIKGLKELKEAGKIEEYYVFKTKGMKISPQMTSSDRVAALLVKGADTETLYKQITLIISEVRVYDINGNPIMQKDVIFLNN